MSGDWRDNLVDDDAGLTRILREAESVAVLGAKAQPAAPAFYVPAYLAHQGYEIRPVNPRLEGHSCTPRRWSPRWPTSRIRWT